MNYFDYFTDIEEEFVRRRGRHLMLSPKDWALMQVWEEREIPLHIVIRAIGIVFDQADKQNTSGSINSLSYCRSAVEEQFKQYSEAHIGGSSEPGPDTGVVSLNADTVSAHITGLIEKLRSLELPQLADDISLAVSQLEAIHSDLSPVTGTPERFDPASVDAQLADVEKSIDLALLTKLATDDTRKADRTVRAQMEPYRAAMDADAFQNTYTLMFLKQIRESAGIPRLSLFYL